MAWGHMLDTRETSKMHMILVLHKKQDAYTCISSLVISSLVFDSYPYTIILLPDKPTDTNFLLEESKLNPEVLHSTWLLFFFREYSEICF